MERSSVASSGVSGQAGVALLVLADGRLASVHSSEPDRIVPRVTGDYHWLFGDAVDLQFIEVEVIRKKTMTSSCLIRVRRRRSAAKTVFSPRIRLLFIYHE